MDLSGLKYLNARAVRTIAESGGAASVRCVSVAGIVLAPYLRAAGRDVGQELGRLGYLPMVSAAEVDKEGWLTWEAYRDDF